MRRLTLAERLDIEKEKIARARSEMESILTGMLCEAVEEIARQYSGKRVIGVSAQGNFTITVKGVPFENYVEVEEGTAGSDVYRKDVEYGPFSGHEGYDRMHPVLAEIADVFDEHGTYPTIKIDVDETGKITEVHDW